MDKVFFTIPNGGHVLKGWFRGLDDATPPRRYEIGIDGYYVGVLENIEGEWHMGGIWGVPLAEMLGNYIELWWE